MKKKDKIKILFVCLGNICRSPLAKGIMQEKINKMGLKDYFHIDSCGTSDYHIGDSPDQRTTENAKNHGLLLTNSARQIEKTDLRFFDLILAMDQSNKKNIHKLDMTDEFEDKIHLMCDFSKNYKGQNVPDPYFGDENGFENVYNLLDECAQDLLEELIEKHNLEL